MESASEATSPYLSSQMVYDTMDDPVIRTDPCNFQSHTNGVIGHVQANHYQLIQGEPSHALDRSRARGCRAKLSEDQRRERKRQRDVKYRQNQRVKVNELSAENKRLQEENGRLTVENKHLEEHVRGLQSRMMHPAENAQGQDSYQPISHFDHQNVYAEDLLGTDSDFERALFDGLEINDLLNLLSPETETNQNVGVAIHESGPGHPESSDMAMNKFLQKLDEDDSSDVDFKDFTFLEGEQTTVGRYSFPLSLVPTVDKINHVHGDVSATSKINPNVVGTIYIFFCATIKEMDDLQLEQVTEKKLLKWRDTIKDALRVNFSVSFAMEHLKKIARAYFGQKGHLLLQSIDARISQLETEVNNWKTKRAETYEGSKSCIAAAQEFTGVPVSTGKPFRLSKISISIMKTATDHHHSLPYKSVS